MARERASTIEVGPSKYWIGLRSDCPGFDSVTVGGVEFCKQTEDVSINSATGQTERVPRKGRIVELDLGRVARIRERAQVKVLRATGARRALHSSENKRYRPHPKDVPLSRYLFMVPVAEDGVTRDREPQPIDES